MKQLVFNCTRQTLVVSELEVPESAWGRMKGLIGRSSGEFRQGRGLLIAPSEGIHTIGMSFPIDVAYLDSEHRVIRTYSQLKPFRIGAVKFRTRCVLELPAGSLRESRTEVGDLLRFLAIEEGSVKCAARC